MDFTWSFPAVFLSLFVLTLADEVEKHLELGKQLLAQGQMADALVHYHAAIDLDPTNYQTLYRRATVYLALGKSKSALPDLDKVVELKADFTAARVQRGTVLFKQGEIDAAKEDFLAAEKVEPSEELRVKIEKCDEMKAHLEQAKQFKERGNCHAALMHLNAALEQMVWDASLYSLRAQCYESQGDISKAIADMRTVTKLVADSTESFLAISKLYYSIGDIENSLGQVRECLKLNPEHEKCFPYYKKVKKLAKMKETLEENVKNNQWMNCLEKAQQILKTEPNVPNIRTDVYRHTCRCNREAGHISEAIAECTEVLENGVENDLDALCERAEAYLVEEMYDEAIEDFRKAKEAHEQANRPREGLQRAEKLKKQAGRKDYYKILNVKRNANKREITKAYRKAAQKWHPDNFSDEKEKKKAELKFIDIAAAKEVLTDDEKRRRFDGGEDPLDPEQQQHHHHGQQFHGGFPHGFHGFPGGGGGDGGPFSFKFHFG